MTIYYPDVSEFQHGQSLHGAVAVCARATEGNWLADPNYAGYKQQAATMGVPFMAYHFLESLSSPQSQAQFCFNIVGRHVPLMLDFEGFASGAKLSNGHTAGAGSKDKFAKLKRKLDWLFGGSFPSMSTALAFVDAFRQLGGICYVLYLPQWYWQQIGSPSLSGFVARGMVLVSSNYSGYSDHGPGWAPYGGMTPMIWQYTSTGPGTYNTDWNAFKGSGGDVSQTVAELESVWTTGKIKPAPPPPPPPPKPSKVLTMNGDEMFYLPIGDGAQVAVDVPLAVVQADGTFKPPTQLVLNAQGISGISLQWAGAKGTWQDVVVDWNRTPTLTVIPTGAAALKIRRAVGKVDPVQVTCSWR